MLKNAPGFSYIRSRGGVDEYRLLKNDLQVLLYRDTSAPVIEVNITYRVGSRNEVVGNTGATHILEHMLFKGSKRFNKKTGKGIWNMLEAKGAQLNATTWLDRTNYYELFPKQYVDDALAIEADRMRHALITDEDLQTEMTVVRNEYERGENKPLEALDKLLWATAFQAHPYHHSTIGWKSDIEQVTAEKLKKFYDTFYWPNNATLIVAGDFETTDILKRIKKEFEKLPRSPHTIPEMTVIEPPQEGMRRVIVERAGELPIVGVAHKMSPALHEDYYPLTVLSLALGGGETSRFQKLLIDKSLATSISLIALPFHDVSLFTTYAYLTPNTTPEQVEKIILAEYEKIAKRGISKEELERAVVMNEVAYVWSRDGVRGFVSGLNEAVAAGDWTFFTEFLPKLKAVKVADIERVAQKYLVGDQATIGYFIPKKDQEKEQIKSK